MAMQAPLTTPKGLGTVQGDTHAAVLQGANTMALASAVKNANYGIITGSTQTIATSGDLGITETEITTVGITPSGAINRIVFGAAALIFKETNNGDLTLRIKEGGVTLLSKTAVNVTALSFEMIVICDALSNVTQAAHTYSFTTQASTFRQRTSFVAKGVYEVDLTGGDTHAAVLQGDPGTCQ